MANPSHDPAPTPPVAPEPVIPLTPERAQEAFERLTSKHCDSLVRSFNTAIQAKNPTKETHEVPIGDLSVIPIDLRVQAQLQLTRRLYDAGWIVTGDSYYPANGGACVTVRRRKPNE